jgi:hypothetical protein
MQPKKSLIALALFFVIAGIALTLENFHVISGVTRLWPVFLSLLGAGFILLYVARSKKDPALIWIGSFWCYVSLLFLYCSYTDWSKMARLWPWFFCIVGASFLATYVVSKKGIFAGLALSFLMLFIIFYLIFSVSLRLWPVSLIIFGMSLLIVNISNKRKEST